MFEKVLIANRGEIACRIIRTLRRMGIRSVAVYSEADADALHVEMADEAYLIGPPLPAESYLRGRAIIEAAKRSRAEAIHPGYGFLAENASFADACVRAGIVFLGPPARVIRAFASKSAARARLAKEGVPLVPGYDGEDQTEAAFRAAARRLGYPILVKATAGGGGRGMRRVDRAKDLAEALASARREAKAAFKDDRLLLEKLLASARHVEIQVFADAAGRTVHLFERDCSVQRRYQKVIEEAPAPGVTEELRERMGETAVCAARAVGYVGAGTVEFLLDENGAFYFMEMNTRLQVEHPVTELVTGLDLVNLQVRIAAGEPLPFAQGEVRLDGHAIEARLYAEDPARGFLPASGRLLRFRLPETGTHLRVDRGVREGDTVGTFYDAMIAKLVVWDRTRGGAIRRLRAALSGTVVVGVPTNLAFLGAVAEHRAFVEGGVDTAFVDRHGSELVGRAEIVPERVLALAALDAVLRLAAEAKTSAVASGDPFSPWSRVDGWRPNAAGGGEFFFRNGPDEVCIPWRGGGGGYRLRLPSGEKLVTGERGEGDRLVADFEGERIVATVVRHGDEVTVHEGGKTHRLAQGGSLALVAEKEAQPGSLASPMPGRIMEIRVGKGARVARGDPLLVIEAMKMEHTVIAPSAGTVEEVRFRKGDFVEEGVELLVFAAEEGEEG